MSAVIYKFTKGHLLKKQKNQAGFAHIMIITMALALGFVGALGYIYWQNFMQPKNSDAKVSSETTPATSTPVIKTDPLADWKTYSNSGVTFKYPKNWYINEYSIPNVTSETITFSNQPYHYEGPIGPSAPKGYRAGSITLFGNGFLTGDSQGGTETLSASTDVQHFLKRANGILEDTYYTTAQTKQIGGNQVLCLISASDWICGVKTTRGIYQFNYLGGNDSFNDSDTQIINQAYDTIVFIK